VKNENYSSILFFSMKEGSITRRSIVAMNKDEALISKTLTLKGFVEIKFEPDGNIPPDFSANRIDAIEVTRLDDSKFVEGTRQGNDQKFHGLRLHIEGLFHSFGLKEKGSGFWIFLNLRGSDWSVRTLVELTKEMLQKANVSEMGNSGTSVISENLTIDYIASEIVSQKFQLGGVMPDAVWTSHELNECLKFAVSEKTRKCKSFKEKYERWHLYLVDHVSRCDEEIIRKLNHRDFDPECFWTTICLVAPCDFNKTATINRN
jgi:hypothetical protein